MTVDVKTPKAPRPRRRFSGRLAVIGIGVAVVALAAATVVGINVIAERDAQRAFEAAEAALQTAEGEQREAEKHLETLRAKATEEHSSASALLETADPGMLSDETAKASLQDLLAQMSEKPVLAAKAEQSNLADTESAPQGRDAKQEAAAKLISRSVKLGTSTKRFQQEATQLSSETAELRKAELALVASAYAKASTLEIPEHASQESKNAFVSATAALQTPAEDADFAALVQGYQSSWQAVVTSADQAAPTATATDPSGIEPTYIRGILVVNKSYGLPSWYGDGLTGDTVAAFDAMQAEAASLGLDIYISSGFRSYESQRSIYNRYVAADGQAEADRYSARPGHSEHQSGLTFDLNTIDEAFAYTPEGEWVRDNAHRFGFVIRYLPGKEHITGYMWEPWHLRYLGVDVATELYNSGLTLEEYLGITSQYAN